MDAIGKMKFVLHKKESFIQKLLNATLEPLLKNTPNACIQPLYKGQILWSLQDHGKTLLPRKAENLSVTVKVEPK